MVTIPGTLDISGGGYLNDKGPGKKLTFILIATSVFKNIRLILSFMFLCIYIYVSIGTQA
jgi:hypothetical protein